MGAIFFLALGLFSLAGAFVIEGGHLGALFVETAAIIVFGGTAGALGLSFPLGDIKRLAAVFKIALSEGRHDLVADISYFIDVAGVVRREGVLALEGMLDKAAEISHMARTGLQLVADGIEEHFIRETLELYAEQASERHHGGLAMFEQAGGFAPTMGIIGTVMGLVHVLGNLSDPGSLGPAIAVAFIATLYGVASANVFWLPIAAKLKALDKLELHHSRVIIEGVMLIQQGANPKMVEERLKAYLAPTHLAAFDSYGRPKDET
ncbi:MAG: MotA/TolQ/ExbB proton channel family protein [Candidatus Lambdaproteobacteria bacterium]|nr:MotA/TolQ/ExbB proton channel family protein [Candidatus Lambdaproteobacteria bacterium]